MSQVTTPAIVLHAFRYGETSKIVRLATRELGVVSAVARGAHRPKSQFGAHLQPLSDGIARLYVRPNRDLQTMAEFDLTNHRAELANDVGRFAAASALAELVLRLAPAEARPEIYDVLGASLDSMMHAEPADVTSVALMAMWSLIGALGFSPALDHCAVDGVPLDDTVRDFSVIEGGFLCAACQRSRETTPLPATDRTALHAFANGRLPDVPLDARHAAAHRRLFVRFVRRHAAEEKDLRALRFWETLSA